MFNLTVYEGSMVKKAGKEKKLRQAKMRDVPDAGCEPVEGRRKSDTYPVYFHRAGECMEEWEGGAVQKDGLYVYPFCHPGCCRPEGPFKTMEEALKVAKEIWDNRP